MCDPFRVMGIHEAIKLLTLDPFRVIGHQDKPACISEMCDPFRVVGIHHEATNLLMLDTFRVIVDSGRTWFRLVFDPSRMMIINERRL